MTKWLCPGRSSRRKKKQNRHRLRQIRHIACSSECRIAEGKPSTDKTTVRSRSQICAGPLIARPLENEHSQAPTLSLVNDHNTVRTYKVSYYVICRRRRNHGTTTAPRRVQLIAVLKDKPSGPVSASSRVNAFSDKHSS